MPEPDAPLPIDEEAIFQVAAALPAAERADYLLAACAGKPALLASVERLLTAHDDDAFMQHQADRTVSPEMKAELARLKPEETGDRIGPYKLLQQIGEGGFGTVWMAEQERPVRRRVALKIIKLGMDTKEVIARFEQERQALAMMEHPNIAKVLDAGATPTGRPYFVMELVRGIKITDYCDQANLPTAERLQLFIAVCHAVQHAHQKGIIHRDLKPSNILVTLHDGVPVPKVIDFGVAKAIQQQRLTDLTLFTQFEQMIGTPLYMSPEQAEMSGLDIDTRSDIYSLGVLLYELLVGRTPFDPAELMKKGVDEIRRTIREQEPQTPSMFVRTMAADLRTNVAQHRHSDGAKLISLIRGDLDWIVMKALEKDRARRYETANDLAKDIERHLSSEPVLARPVSQLYRFRRLVKRNKLAFAAGGAVATAMLLAVIDLVFSNARIRNETNQKLLALREKGAALLEAQASAQAAKEQRFVTMVTRASASRHSGQMGQRFDSLEALAEAARIHPDERLRDESTVAMALPDVHPGPHWISDRNVAVDGSYTLSAKADAEGIIIVRSIPDRRELGRVETGCQIGDGGLIFSKDGHHLLQLASDATWRVWHWEDARLVLGPLPHATWGVDFSPDGRLLAIGQADHIIIFSLATGLEVNRWRVREPPTTLAFHPDNRRLAIGYNASEVVCIFDSETRKHLGDFPIGPVHARVLAWHPDGVRLAIGGADPRIQIWNVNTWLKVATLDGHVNQVSRLTFHPDGELLASDGWEGVCRIWQPSSGRQLMQFSGLGPFSFSKDGRWLGGDGLGDRGRLLEAASSPEYRTVVSSLGMGKGDYLEGDISPDDRLLAFGMGDGVRIWDLSTLRELAFLPIGKAECVIFQPDGRELLTCGAQGLQRWPIQISSDAPNAVRLGPPTRLSLPFTPTRACRSPDGRTLAVVSDSGGGMIINPATGLVTGQFLSHESAGYVGLSPDGKYVATSGWHSDRSRLWDVASGSMVHEWILGEQMTVAFSPDSRTLITCRAEEFGFWDVTSFQPVRRLRSERGDALRQAVFSPDGRLMAAAHAPAVVHLEEVASGRTVAKIEDPHGERITWIGFSADGSQLLTASNYSKSIHVWDLRAIRARLKVMHLDWDWPEFPPASESPSPTTKPIRSIEVVAGPPVVQAIRWDEALKLGEETLALRRKALAPADPATLGMMGNLADSYDVAGRKKEADTLRTQIQTIKEEALPPLPQMQPGDLPTLRTRTEHRARLGRWKEAIADLARVLELDSLNHYDWYLLAPLLLEAGDVDGYYKHRREMLAKFGSATDLPIMERIAKASLVLPADGVELETAGKLADAAVTLGKDHEFLPYFQFADGLAHYRSGQFREAVAMQQMAITSPGVPERTAQAYAVLAMAHHRLGEATEARAALVKAEEMAVALPPKPDDHDLGRNWQDVLIARQLVKEAEALLGKPAAPPP